MFNVQLKAGREKSLLRGHPWIFSGSIGNFNPEEDQIISGETVRVIDKSGSFLAWGAISPASKIRVRVWSQDHDINIDSEFFRSRLHGALHRDLRNLIHSAVLRRHSG